MGELFELASRFSCDRISGPDGRDYQPVVKLLWMNGTDETRNRHYDVLSETDLEKLLCR
jgi:hypothetical protein